MKLKQRDIALISIAASVLLVLVWYFLWYQPKGDEIANKQLDKESVEQELARAKAATARLPQLMEDVKLLEADKQAFVEELPETLRFGEFLQDLRQIVIDSGSTLNSIAPTASTQTDLPAGVVAVNVNMTLDTTFPGLLNVVAAIQDLQRFSTINKIDLKLTEVTQATAKNPPLSVTMAMTVYTFDVSRALQQQQQQQEQTTPPQDPNATPAPQGGNAS
ncbi:type 4a pilus biogenesis protein PilO [Deinococcus roseus]|uniref:Pilus assembly protein PilO n=1 Tax=Deinococcus roseus TaxID=392414 RepID=A0ABQ2CZV1_9DEIO|nr:type 4a pilus biogenesis protein PilO [Deinococcus roseus]GGJ30796.1 hypothetical protein GCM10008938_16060 [Deinococcus roseus]